MKRDVDLCRQLLFDLEAHGAECAVSVLRDGAASDADRRVRFHLRLLVDAGLVKEVEHVPNSGTASVRLTNAGIELIEVCRSDVRWRDAKATVMERTGGVSLSVLRTLLTKWAVEAVTHGEIRRPYRSYRSQVRHVSPPARYSGYVYDREQVGDDLRLIRNTPDYHERLEWRERRDDLENCNGYHVDHDALEPKIGVSLPIYLV